MTLTASLVPKRIQRRRIAGWRMPDNTVYVGRPSRWGNPYRVGTWSNTLGRPVETVEEAVRLYEEVIWGADYMAAHVAEVLGGKNLACWCRLDQPCHADVLLKLANQEAA